MDFRQQTVEIFHRPELVHDGLIVANVIAVVIIRRFVHRTNPDDVDAEVFQVIEFVDDALNIANPVPVRIIKTARVDLISDSFFPPVSFQCFRLCVLVTL